LLAVSKPAGLLTIPDGYNPQLPHLAGLLQAKFGHLWVVHRLDKDTSGVVILARSAEAHRRLNEQFSRRSVQKTYLAIAAGHPAWEVILADFPLRVNGDRAHRTVIDSRRGKPAATDLQVQARYPSGWSLVQAQPHSGYTHQIRAHLAWLGHPIANDPLYAVPRQSPAYDPNRLARLPLAGLDRLALHAYRVELTHPFSGEPLVFTASQPDDFSTALYQLEAESNEEGG
jgi:RluA family pseudouridine synthase